MRQSIESSCQLKCEVPNVVATRFPVEDFNFDDDVEGKHMVHLLERATCLKNCNAGFVPLCCIAIRFVLYRASIRQNATYANAVAACKRWNGQVPSKFFATKQIQATDKLSSHTTTCKSFIMSSERETRQPMQRGLTFRNIPVIKRCNKIWTTISGSILK